MRTVIANYEARRAQQLTEVQRTERLINDLLADLGEEPRYKAETGTTSQVTNGVPSAGKRSRFYGKPLATAVRTILAERGEEPANPAEILTALEAGDFDFDGLKWKKEHRLRALAMSLAKNTATFHRLPSGAFGLLEWYPTVAKGRARGSSKATAVGEGILLPAASGISEPTTDWLDDDANDEGSDSEPSGGGGEGAA